MLNERQIMPSKFIKASDDFVRYAARFLLLAGQDQESSPLFRELVNFIFQYSPTSEIYSMIGYTEEQSGPMDVAALEESTGLASLSPEELKAIDALMARDEEGLEVITKAIKQELGQGDANLEDVLKAMTQFKDEEAPTAPDPAKETSASKYQEKLIDLLRDHSNNTEPYFDNLKSKFYSYVQNSFKKFGKQSFIDANPRLSDQFPGKTEMSKEFTPMARGMSLSDNFVRDVLSKDEYYTNPQEINSLVSKLEAAVKEKYQSLGGAVTESFKLVLDLNEAKRVSKLDESFILMFRTWIKIILKFIFGDTSFPVQVKGTPSEVAAFGKAITGEKKYIDSIKKYGLNNRQTYTSRAELASSIRNFERETGLKWPFV